MIFRQGTNLSVLWLHDPSSNISVRFTRHCVDTKPFPDFIQAINNHQLHKQISVSIGLACYRWGADRGDPSVPAPLPSHLTPRQYPRLSWSASPHPHRWRFSRAPEYFASSVENGGFAGYSDTRPEIWGARYTRIMRKEDTQNDTNTTTSNEKVTWVSVACSQNLWFSLLRWSSARTEIKPGRGDFLTASAREWGMGKRKNRRAF